jgi:enediyne biosynthesis protein E4
MMNDNDNDRESRPPRRVVLFGTAFLLFQILFALNNYGPQRIPGLNLVFDRPFVAAAAGPVWGGTPTGQFEDVTARSGLAGFRRAAFDDRLPRYVEVMGGGVAVGDFDGDGHEDIFFTSLPSFNPRSPEASRSSLFRNRGDGTFEDVTEAVGLAEIAGHPQGALFFDADNNGLQDLYVAAYAGGQFFRNEGGAFRDATAEAGLSLEGRCGTAVCFGIAAAAADYDRDGLLDLFIVANVEWDMHDPAQVGPRRLLPTFYTPQRSFLFRNNGDGTFTDVTAKTGVDNQGGKGLGAVWADFDGDGWPDLYVTNDMSRNTLYRNNGDGTFTEIAAAAGVNEVKSSMGVTVGDFDNSGRLDIAITNLKGSKISLFRNLGDMRFEYVTDLVGLGPSTRSSGWGIEFVDFDLDGHPDLVMSSGPVWEESEGEANDLLFRNRGAGHFEDVTVRSGAAGEQVFSRGLAVVDADGDGWPDLVFANVHGATPRLLRNRAEQPHRWLQLRLEGTESNRDAVGARVEIVRSDGVRLVQEVRAGSSYQSGSSRALFFGFGGSKPAEITVSWPSGRVETIGDPPLDRIVQIREGSGIVDR